MLNFKTPVVEDKKWVQPIIEKSGYMGCDISFANTFLWRKKYNIRIAEFNGYLIKSSADDNSLSYGYPLGAGTLEEEKAAIDAIIADAKERNQKEISLFGLNNTTVERLQSIYPDKFVITPQRDDFDYIYTSEHLATLAGRKNHGKRSHISKFKRENENYSYKEITADNLSDALLVSRLWCSERGCTGAGAFSAEYCAIKDAFKYFDELSLFGGILYIDDKPVAMTIASKINDEVCDVHFEKAVSDVDGAYPMINNEFSKTMTGFKYLNREEDLGIEGLRKAKLSYRPDILLEKYTALLEL